MITGPLFKWFGSKWLSAKRMPPPEHDTIIEPYAGSAGYSLRYAEKNVILCESDVNVNALWRWLIRDASEAAVREIPVGLPIGTDILSLDLAHGQKLLLKHWQRTNNVGDCWTISPWGDKPGQWTENTRARVAEEISAVKHWEIYADAFAAFYHFHDDPSVTWFVDPPYQFNYKYRGAAPDYAKLATRLQTLHGQVIACEAVCQKTGAVPSYLPFEFFGSRVTSRRKAENNHHSKELLWTNRV